MLIIAFLCLFYAYNIGWNSHEFAEAARAAVKWPVTSGTVRISRGHKSISQYYDYSVSGKDYQNAPKGFALQGGDVRRDRASGQSGVCCC